MALYLQAQKISKSFGDFKAVDEVSIQIEPGNCFALLGPNGAGKTTTIDMLIGLQNPDKGSVTVFDKAYASARSQIYAEIGIVLQQTNLYKKFTVHETLSLFASFYQNSESPNDLIELLQLKSKAHERIEKLSGGMKQRLHLACALIHKPKLLFLDEPTTGLDPQSRQLLWSLIEDLKKTRKCGILLTTHYMEEAEHLADLVGIIDHGKIIEQGTPHELIQKLSFKNSMIVEVEGSFDQSILTSRGFAKNFKGLLEKRFDNFDDKISSDLTAVSDMGGIKNISFRQSNLEDVFIKHTGRGIRD